MSEQQSLWSGVAQEEHPPNREYAGSPTAGACPMTPEEIEAFKEKCRAAIIR